MLPRPRFLALIAFERIKRDDQHPLGAFGAQARVDVVQWPRGGRYAERRRNAARQTIEIIVRAERLCSVGRRTWVGGVEIDDVEVRRVGKFASSQPAKRDDDQLAAREASMN